MACVILRYFTKDLPKRSVHKGKVTTANDEHYLKGFTGNWWIISQNKLIFLEAAALATPLADVRSHLAAPLDENGTNAWVDLRCHKGMPLSGSIAGCCEAFSPTPLQVTT